MRPAPPELSGREPDCRSPGLATLLVGLTLLAPAGAYGAGAAAGSPTAGAGGGPCGAPTAEGDSAWNSPRVLALVSRVGRGRRATPGGAPGLESFRARADAHVYYLFDPGSLQAAAGPGRRLARADQVALRVEWTGPGRWHQRIVGRRSRTFLPVDLTYHTDHLGVVMENFGSRIRMGEGTEVRGVLHPTAPGADSLYDYRLVDSLGVAVGGERRRIYRVEFRPRRSDAAAAVGTLYLDGTRPAVARMRFTFTPESYLDPQIEEITVDLQSALVEGRYWLPAEQETTIRRRLRWLDFPVGGTIHTRTRIYGYEVNPEPGPRIVRGGRITARPDSALRAYGGWTAPLLSDHADRRPPEELDVEGTRAEARRMLVRSRLGASTPLRVHLPDGSHLLRIRRAEGVLVGAGGAYDGPSGSWRAWAGHPFGRERPEASLSWRSPPGWSGGSGSGTAIAVEGCLRCLRDVGPFPAASGALSSAWAVLDGEDFTDPYFRSGASVGLRWEAGDGSFRARLGWEEVAPARLEPGPLDAGLARPVRAVDDGSGLVARGELSRPLGPALGTRWRLELQGEAASREMGDFGYSRLLARLEGEGRSSGGQVTWRAGAAAGASAGTLPPHRLFLLGGRGTLPGHPFRKWGGSRVAMARADVTATVVPPWISARALAAAGWAEPGSPARAAARRFDVGATGGVRASVGAGVALFWDLLRVDLARGLDGGEWQWQVSVNPDFWPIL